METKRLLNAKDVAKLLDISERTALRRIKQLNDELEAEGYFTEAGRISSKRFFEKYYLEEETS